MGRDSESREGASTLRLLMPQWQGGGNRPAYYLGGRLLAWLSPPSTAAFEEVPIELRSEGLTVDRGIFAREVVLKQARAAKRILEERRPDRVVVFGGECSVDFAPFAYLNQHYDGDLGILWVDAHPDVARPEGDYPYFHAMVMSALLGIGDPEFVAEVPKLVDPRHVMYAGLRAALESLEELRVQTGAAFPYATVEQIESDSSVVLDWLHSSGVSHVAVHFDLDVLEPTEFNSALGLEPNGLHTTTVVRLLADVGRVVDIVGLGITEYTPRDAMLLSDMLRRLPLVSDP
jgi:arginase